MRADPALRHRFVRLAVPNILSNVTVPLVGLVDTAILGHLPDIRYLAGVALAAVIFDYAYWSFGFLRMGTTGAAAQAAGREDAVELSNVLWRALLLAAGLAALLLLLQRPIAAAGFGLLGGSPAVEAAGRDYFDARIWGAPATLANYALLGWLLGRERAGAALTMTLVANVANAALDWWLIVVLGQAAAGAGAATAFSQYLMLVVGFAIVIRDGALTRPRWSEVADRARLRDLVKLNRDLLVRTLALLTTFALFTNVSAMLGTVVLAANSILHRLQMVAAYLIDGAAFATESLAGNYRGRGDLVSLRRLLRIAMATGVAFALPVLAALWLVPERVYGLMTSHAEVADVAAAHAPWMAPVLLIGAVAFIYDGYFIGLTEGKVLRDQMLVSATLFFLPLAALAAARHDNHLLWAAMTLLMIGRVATMWREDRRLMARLRAGA